MDKILIPLIFILLPFDLFGNDSALPTSVTLTTHNLPPYGSFVSDDKISMYANQDFRGIAVDRVRCVMKKLEIKSEIIVVPWKRAQAMAQDNRAHGFFAASQQAARDEYAVMSDVIADQKWTWYLLNSNPLTPKQSNFKRKASVSSFNGANMQKYLHNNGYNVGSNPDDTEQLFQMLIKSRIDAALANNLVMDNILKQQEAQHLVKSFTLKNKPLGVYFTKEFLSQFPTVLDQFNQKLKQCLD